MIVTESAKHFYTPNDIPNHINILSDADEWAQWKKRGDPVLHIDLGKWADIFLIAPLDANTLAKIANVYTVQMLKDKPLIKPITL